MKSKSKKGLERVDLKGWIKKEIVKTRFKWLSLFFLGFLIGVMFKSQAARTIVVGYDDHNVMQNSTRELSEINLTEIKD